MAASILRYVGEAFEQGGAWYRQGKLGPYRIADQLDTTRVWTGRADGFCAACQGDRVAHSWRFHQQAVQLARRKAVCAPSRQIFRPIPPFPVTERRMRDGLDGAAFR